VNKEITNHSSGQTDQCVTASDVYDCGRTSNTGADFAASIVSVEAEKYPDLVLQVVKLQISVI
jgi:hypothetical protein